MLNGNLEAWTGWKVGSLNSSVYHSQFLDGGIAIPPYALEGVRVERLFGSLNRTEG